MNKGVRGKGVYKTVLWAGTLLFLGFLLMSSCREETFPYPEFSSRIDKLRHWTNKGWTGYPYKEEKQLLDDLCGYIQAEQDTGRREMLYAQFTNTLINVPFFSTNGVQKTNEFPRGLYQPPYWDRKTLYLALLRRAEERSLYTNLFDVFCLNLETWKRLRREQKDCPRIVEKWMTLRYEDCPRRWIEKDVRYSLWALSNAVQDIERSLERSLEYLDHREPDKSRRAHELFREVIGHDDVVPFDKR